MQAISRASEDTGTVLQSIAARYSEFTKRDDSQSKDVRESALNDIKQLHATLSSICQTLETSQELVSQVLYPTEAPESDSAPDSEPQVSYNEIDKVPSCSHLDSFQEQQIRDDTQIEQRKQVKTKLNRSHSSNFSSMQSISKKPSNPPAESQPISNKPSVPTVDLPEVSFGKESKNDRSDTEYSSERSERSNSSGRTPLSPKAMFSSIDEGEIPREKKLKTRIPSKTKLRLFPV